MQIHFFSPSGYKPMKDAVLKSMIGGSHGWQDTGETWVFGVVEVRDNMHAANVRDKLESLGVIHIPSANDQETPVDARVYEELKKFINVGDRTRKIVSVMSKFHPLLRLSE